MTRQRFYYGWLLVGLAAFPAFGDTAPKADTPRVEDLYRLDVIVFAHEKPGAGALERWEPPVTLTVPSRRRPLRTPLAVPDTPTVEATPTADSADHPDSDTAASPTEPAALPMPLYARLDDADKGLKDAAEHLRWHRHYRLLFHESWYQWMPPDTPRPAIIIRGGEAFGDHHELEGTLSVHRERYLHANARLWLTRFSPNVGQEEADWPRLPVLAAPEPPGKDDTDNTSMTPTSDAFGATPADWLHANSPLMPLAQAWVIDRIAVLDQQRKLRSEETHYLDHPLFGVMLRVTPWDVLHPQATPENPGDDPDSATPEAGEQ